MFAGIGNRQRDAAEFLTHCPHWPQHFGVPYTSSYDLQGSAYADVLKGHQYSRRSDLHSAVAVSEFIVAVHQAVAIGQSLNVLAIGPLPNIAKALALDPSIALHLKLFTQGGMKNGRLGYNHGLNLVATHRVLESAVDVTIISSTMIGPTGFASTLQHIQVLPQPLGTFG